MKTTVTQKILGGGTYSSPEIEIFESVVERGFQVSDDFLYGNYDYAGDSFHDENGDGGYNDLGNF